ncbi:MAG: RagB/SusD family nutrient uptake outer membrane protein [Muribaculaceae bacterium]|nr:RagB/SusD family nutrient uptake outer membrane protein [Muribaculaceae bacterium]
MKKFKINILALLSALLACGSFSSCTDYLDKAPESEISEDEAFKNFKNFQGFVEEMYFCLPNFTTIYWNNSFNWGEDEFTGINETYMMCDKVDKGDFWGWQSEHDGWGCGFMDIGGFDTGKYSNVGDQPTLWKGSWYAIRKANLGLANLDRMTQATDEERRMIKGQLLFFRGFYHFMLMQYFGGLPYIDEVLGSSALTNPRLTYAECAEKAAADLRAAADLLPIDWDTTLAGAITKGNNKLRINKIMALGYLGKDLLWAGSPLMTNDPNLAAHGGTKLPGNSLGYNEDFCKRAADALGELLNLVESGQTQYALVPFENYKDLFLSHSRGGLMPGSTEAIYRNPCDDWNRSNWGQTNDYGTKFITDNGICYHPTANYVNYYGMANGLPLDDPDSGFDKTHPWKGRDPRFYHDIRYDGCKLELGGNTEADDVRYAPLYTGGKLRSDTEGSRSGYLNYKFVRDDFNKWDNQGGGNWGASNHMLIPYMRLADVYLMYAEAACNAYGTPSGKSGNFSKTAVQAINTIRQRAGVAGVNNKFLGSLESFMGEVRRERAVELAFESHRFTDLRRWMLIDKYPYNIKTSQEFTRSGNLAGIDKDSSVGINKNDPTQNAVVGFTEKVVVERPLTSKHYWLPLKVKDVSMYPEFYQNPGW